MINKKRLVKTFLDLVKISSPSESEDAIAAELVRRLKKLGAEIVTDSYGNVIGKFDRRGRPFMLNAHMDTVSPGENIKPIINGDVIKSDGTTVLGGDPKAGVAAILEALESIVEDKKTLPALDIVFTRSEEIGLLGAVNLDYKKVRAKQGVTFDGEAGLENITVSAPGYYKVDATIIGRSAHAGAEPEKGISAIKIASEIISQLPLGRIDEETTCNVGLIEGGSARNAVPEETKIQAEIRSRDNKKLDNVANQFREIFKGVMSRYPNAKLDLKIELKFGPYRVNRDNPVIQKIVSVFKKMAIKPIYEDSGGGTDDNIFFGHGITAICVGTGDYEAHTKREYVLISEMEKAARFCEMLIESL